MGIILTTINTFFGIINTLLMVVNILLLGSLIFALVYIGPKIKSIYDAYTEYQAITTDTSVNKCLTYKEHEDLTKKINIAKDNIEYLRKLPGIGSLIPSNIDSLIFENINNISICQ